MEEDEIERIAQRAADIVIERMADVDYVEISSEMIGSLIGKPVRMAAMDDMTAKHD